MMVWRNVGIRERKREQTAMAIEAVALRLFQTKGYLATTVEDIAAAADVSRATVFRYFPAKDDIVFVSHPADAEAASAIASRHVGRGSLGACVRATVRDFAGHLCADEAKIRRRAVIVGTDQRLLGRSLTAQADWTRRMVAELAPSAGGRDDDEARAEVLVAAALAAMRVAIVRWSEGPPGTDLGPGLEAAFDALGLPVD
jgi:AcrR family transcriptional regulator